MQAESVCFGKSGSFSVDFVLMMLRYDQSESDPLACAAVPCT